LKIILQDIYSSDSLYYTVA